MIPYAHRIVADDPGTVPVRDAATVMIVADRPHLEILMVRRTPRATFGPGAWVFPGGRVDETDAAVAAAVTSGLTDVAASERLDVADNGLAWWYAGLRETAEEAGLIIGAAHAEPAVLDRIRRAVAADAGSFDDALEAEGVVLDVSGMYDVARFVTPVGPPRRFDTRFFVAMAPPDQRVYPDEEEIIDHCWVRPADAMEASHDGDLPMMTVTYRMIACAARYASAAQLMATAATRPPAQQVRVNDPTGAYHVVLPGDPGYETADVTVEHGWVRL